MSEKEDNTMAAVSYVLGFITGLAVYLTQKEKGNKFVLFHAMQSIISSIVGTIVIVVIAIPILILSVMGPLAIIGCVLDVVVLIPIAIISLAFMVFMAYKAYKGVKFKLPAIGDMAEKQIK